MMIKTNYLTLALCMLTLFIHACSAAEIAQKNIREGSVGEIIFTDFYAPKANYLEKDLVKTLKLKQSKNLYFTAFLDQPLTDYLRELAPNRNDKELNGIGNFRFSFIVDNTVVYAENLNLGAMLPSQKLHDRTLSKPFFSELNEDSWGRFLWARFMHFGGEDVLTEGRHHLKVELRSYVKLDEVKVGRLIAQGEIDVDVIKPVATEEQIKIQAIAAIEDWSISTESYDKKMIRELNKKIIQEDFRDINSIVVIKNGDILIEQYFNGSQRSSLHDARSVGKSIASTMLGIAVHEKHIDSADQTISEFYNLEAYENFSREKAMVSLRELATMSSGFEGDDSDLSSKGNEENMYPTDDWVKFTLDLPMADHNEDEKQWAYFTAGTVLLGDVIDKSVPDGLEQYTQRKLFEPLGVKDIKWQYTPQNIVNTAGGIRLRAIDFAKYGQLYKNKGSWNGRQIIPESWAIESLSRIVSRDKSSTAGHYGYLFWNDTVPFGNKLYDVAYASGNGGNKIFIFKDLPIVVVITAKAYNKNYAHKQVNTIMSQYILPAIL